MCSNHLNCHLTTLFSSHIVRFYSTKQFLVLENDEFHTHKSLYAGKFHFVVSSKDIGTVIALNASAC